MGAAHPRLVFAENQQCAVIVVELVATGPQFVFVVPDDLILKVPWSEYFLGDLSEMVSFFVIALKNEHAVAS